MDIFGPVDSIYADVAAEHPTQLTDAHLGVTAKMHHARADGPNFMRRPSATAPRSVPRPRREWDQQSATTHYRIVAAVTRDESRTQVRLLRRSARTKRCGVTLLAIAIVG